MSDCSPGLVIDLGAGDGALVGEASLRWNQARFITVDIDHNAGSSSLYSSKNELFTHHVGDALAQAIDQKIDVPFGSVDSALCNPPYIRPKWQKHFGEILEDAGMSHIMPKMKCVPAEVLFIAQNLRFLKKGGKLGLILPDGVIAGEKYSNLRGILATSHCLERVIELPRGVFRKTDAKAHIVVLTKNKAASEFIRVQRLEAKGLLSNEISLLAEKASTRLDYSYLVSTHEVNELNEKVRLREVTQMLKRGTYTSATLRACLYPVFHTTDFEAGNFKVPNRFLFSDQSKIISCGVVASPGDILIARVGRNLEEKICIVDGGSVLVSDCILVLRLDAAVRDAVFKYLVSGLGRSAIRAISHGVSAKFITTEALLDLQIYKASL